jgi:hypothetical protein
MAAGHIRAFVMPYGQWKALRANKMCFARDSSHSFRMTIIFYSVATILKGALIWT